MNSKTLKKITKRRIKVLLDPIKDYLTVKDFKRRAKYSKLYEKLPLKNNYLLYESRDGKSMTDSPYAIFKYLLRNPVWKDLVHVWVVSEKEYLRNLRIKYKNHHNVKFVLRNSDQYFKYLATSKYLFNNSTFQNFYTVKKGQVYTNTWHGTPLKHMGFDIEGSPMGSSNVLRNFLSTDYILSPNKFTTDIFNNGFKLKNLYNGTILDEGYPRIDLTINANGSEVKQLLNEDNIDLGNKKMILYAPTWKGDKISKPRNDIEQIINDIKRLEDEFGNEYTVLVKVHPFLYHYAKSEVSLKGNLVSDTFETNELLSVTDILITDYSSIFFDYLVTGKPILFYMWDYDDYHKNRGMYINVTELPGPISTSIENLIQDIGNIEKVQEEYKETYNSFVEKFCYHDYGNVTRNVVKKVFGLAAGEQENNVDNPNAIKKEKILLYAGGFVNNGITGALLNLLNNIDYKKYDVTILLNHTNKDEVISNILKVNSNVRTAFKAGRMNKTVIEEYRNYIIKNRGVTSQYLENLFPTKMYQREFQRLFGNAEFDYIIDFNGYSMFWANILLAGEAKKKMIFMHSDLSTDRKKVVKGRRPHYINLRSVFTLYKYFDELVSVSEATMKVNKEKLQEYIGDTKVSYIINSLTPDRIKQQSKDDSDVYFKNNKPVLVNVNQKKQIIDVPVPEQEEDYINFINIGRLSPEKGQDQLIEAFAKIQKEHKNTRLYIVGEGASRGHLASYIDQYGLKESVFLVGYKSNPFYLMGRCDAFVLSSHYEGQPLVLLESLTLGLNTIATDIVANRYVLEDGKYGNLVDNSVDGLCEGMLAVIEDNIKTTKFDIDKYNEKAMESFYKTLEL